MVPALRVLTLCLGFRAGLLVGDVGVQADLPVVAGDDAGGAGEPFPRRDRDPRTGEVADRRVGERAEQVGPGDVVLGQREDLQQSPGDGAFVGGPGCRCR